MIGANRSAPSVNLILTATVAPKTVPALVQVHVADRFHDYRQALKRWGRKATMFQRVHWWENSNHQLAHDLASEFSSAVVPHIFGPEDFDTRLGKGYGEALMLERIASDDIDADHYLKCTGRLTVSNISALISAFKRTNPPPDLVISLAQDLSYVDTRLFLVSSELMPKLVAGLKSEVDDSAGRYLEHAVARRVLLLASSGTRIGFWKDAPRFCGTSASTGQRYDSLAARLRWPAASLLYKLKRHGTFI